MVVVTAERLRKLAPAAKVLIIDAIAAGWPEADAAGINTEVRAQQFLAELAVETGGFTLLEENLNYSAKRLVAVWPGRFPTEKAAAPYAHNPQALANKVYGGRMGNTGPNDGWLYRGSGMGQTTGRNNFRAAGHEQDPDSLRQDPGVAFASAIKFWTDNGLNAIADRDDTAAVRRIINGGTNGLGDAVMYRQRAAKIFMDDDGADEQGMAVVDWRSIQQRLKDLGYAVGVVDGQPGSNTRGALLAFKADNALPLTLDVDAATASALLSAQPKPVAPARAEATTADLRASGSRIITASDNQKTIGSVVGGLSALAGGAKVTGITDALNSVGSQASGLQSGLQSALAPLKSIIGIVTDNLWLIGLIVGAIVVYEAVKIGRAKLDDHQNSRMA